MNEMQSRASTWCEYYECDGNCVLMRALSYEDDPRCKLFRSPVADCRYFRLVVMKPKRGR